MAKYVVFIQVDRDSARDGSTPQFAWDVREFLGGDGTSPAEKAGPSLVQGTAPTVAEAKTEAESWAVLFAQQTIYVYQTP